MGIRNRIMSCAAPFHSIDSEETESRKANNELTRVSSTCLSSQPSLTSLPSLQSQTSLNFQSTTNPHRCIATLTGHSSSVFSLALAGKFVYSGSSSNKIRQWLAESDSCPNSATVVAAAGTGAVKALLVSGEKLYSGHQDNKIRVWRIAHDQYTLIAVLPTLKDRILRFLPPKNHIQVRRHKKCTWIHHVDAISALALHANGLLLYSVSWDRTLKIWRTTDFKCLESVANAHDDAINAVVVSGDGFIYTGSADKTVKVWTKREGERRHTLVATLERHKSAVNALALSTTGSELYSGACDRSIVVWQREVRTIIGDDATTAGSSGGGAHMCVVGALKGHLKAILCLAVVLDLVCSGSADHTVRIWRKDVSKVNSYSCLAILEGHRGPVKCLAVSHDGSGSSSPSSSSSCFVYSGSLDRDIKVWQVSIPVNQID